MTIGGGLGYPDFPRQRPQAERVGIFPTQVFTGGIKDGLSQVTMVVALLGFLRHLVLLVQHHSLPGQATIHPG